LNKEQIDALSLRQKFQSARCDMTVITRQIKVLAAAASIIVLAGMALPAEAGTLGGVVGGVSGAVSGAVGGVTGAVSGAVGGTSGALGGAQPDGQASSDTSSSPNGGVPGSTRLGDRAIVKLKANLLGIKAGVYALDEYGNLVRVKGRIGDRFLTTNANVYVLRHGSLAKVNANADLAGLDVKAKVYVLDRHGRLLDGKAFVRLGGLKANVAVNSLGKKGKLLSANAKVRLGHAAALKATAGINAGTSGVDAGVKVSLGVFSSGVPGTGGGSGGAGNGNGNSGNSGNIAGNDRGISHEIAGLSDSERRQLARKCPSVLSSPANYSADAVRVCRVVGQLAGL
jgi:hypothetical protein